MSIAGPTLVAELKDDRILEYTVAPQDFGLKPEDVGTIRVDGVEASKEMLLSALNDRPGAARDIVALNAGASIYVAGAATTLGEGVKKALATISSGGARRKLDQFVAFTRHHG
jgi:anthranilate phosphoribosyltransferase